jgi:hypothetical protein
VAAFVDLTFCKERASPGARLAHRFEDGRTGQSVIRLDKWSLLAHWHRMERTASLKAATYLLEVDEQLSES